jgi:hypothetical protein
MTELGQTESTDDARLISFGAQITVAFTLLAAITHIAAQRFDLVFAIVSTVLFAIGLALLALGFWNGIERSRVDEVTLSGLVSIDKTHVPTSARNRLWAMIVVQIVVGVLFASFRPFTLQTFGLLVPTFGLGIATLWGSRFAAFHPRDQR